MRWQGNRESDNVEDRRGDEDGGGGDGAPFGGGGGGGGGLPFPPGMLIKGGAGTIILAIIIMFLGGDPMALLRGPGGPQQQQQQGPGIPNRNVNVPAAPRPGLNSGAQNGAAEDEMKKFVRTVLADTEDTWTMLFRKMNKTYKPSTLVLFSNHTRSGCGEAESAVGPFYCPADEKVYIDLVFFQDLQDKFKSPGEFARAYVIAHEIGHHVQDLLGVSTKVHNAQRGLSKAEANKLSVMLELQADFLAGVWAHHADKARSILENGDVEAALNAASAIGDDRLQKQARGFVVPDSFTHGTSNQRMRWFTLGLKTGDINQGDTFNAPSL
jgi:hypothetical protein